MTYMVLEFDGYEEHLISTFSSYQSMTDEEVYKELEINQNELEFTRVLVLEELARETLYHMLYHCDGMVNELARNELERRGCLI